MGSTYEFFTRLSGTLAVILLVSVYAGSTQIIKRYLGKEEDWKSILLVGCFGGFFGIYGNLSGFDLNGAVISVRDIGPMLAGFIGGPFSGIVAGAIAGVHRLTMGGVTAVACVVATSLIGLFCGIISMTHKGVLKRFYRVFLVGVCMEMLHLSVVLVLVKPFSLAADIVRQVAVPFVTVNAVGIASMMWIIRFFEKQQAESLEKEKLKSELEMASVIQHSFLPTIDDRYPGRPEVAVSASMQAAKEVGGDFYDAFYVDRDRIAFIIGDVSGKGVPAALFMVSSKMVLQSCIRDIPNLADAFATANNVLCEKNEADMFVTVWGGVLDLRSGELTCVSAGHNPPVFIHDGVAKFPEYKNGFLLAGMEGSKYHETKFNLAEGDAVFIYTDGVTEATTKGNELYGNDRLLECLSGCGGDTVQEIVDKVKKSVDDFVKDAEQFDDITMLCFKWK